jgi:hypothetical protein
VKTLAGTTIALSIALASPAIAADSRTIDWLTSPKQTHVFTPPVTPAPIDVHCGMTREEMARWGKQFPDDATRQAALAKAITVMAPNGGVTVKQIAALEEAGKETGTDPNTLVTSFFNFNCVMQ